VSDRYAVKNCALVLLALTVSALAGTYSVPQDEPVVSVKIPENWKVKEREEFIEGTPPDAAVHVLVLAVEGTKVVESMGEGVRYIRNSGAIVIKDGRGKTNSMMMNGKPVQSISWDGRDPHGEIKLHCHVVSGKDGKPALVFMWGSPAAEKKYDRELKQILEGVRAG
jgi:hypothetical protein